MLSRFQREVLPRVLELVDQGQSDEQIAAAIDWYACSVQRLRCAFRAPAIPGEEWRPVAGYEGLYEVSDHGRVRSLKQDEYGRMLSVSVNESGYHFITLSGVGKARGRPVHHVVLEAFVGPRPPEMEACHYDGDPGNNRASNLRWDTRAGNARDRQRHVAEQRERDLLRAWWRG